MKYLYHGTTLEAMQEIIKGKYDPNKTNWDCSNPGNMYCWDEDLLAEWEDVEEDEKERLCLERANEDAQIANAVLENPNDLTYVLKFELENDLYKELEKGKFIYKDESCENMYGSIEFDSCKLNQLIKEKKIHITVYTFKFYVKMSLFYLISLIDNPYFQETLEKMPSFDYEALQKLSKTEGWAGIYEDLIYQDEPVEYFEV